LLKDYEKEAKKFSSVPWSFKDGAIKYCLNDSILLRKVVNSHSLTAVIAVPPYGGETLTATLEGVSLDSLSPLLTRGEVLKFDQTKWLRSMDQATISILKTVYTLRVTENKRELVYDLDGLLVGSKSFIL
jgi:hypothetical protein